MDDHRFDKPVPVEVGRTGMILNVGSTREAAEVLLFKWPQGKEAASSHRVARQACHDVLAGLKKAHVARKAFEAAADEADILAVPSKSAFWKAP